MTFEIGQIFYNEYPPQAAAWCNNNRAYITELEPQDGTRRFQIVAVPEPTEEEKAAALQAQYTALIQSILDTEAQKLGYDNCLSVCSYIDTGVNKYDTEGKAFRQWRSAVWEAAYTLLDKILTGDMDMPTKEELIELLPKLNINYTTTGYTI